MKILLLNLMFYKKSNQFLKMVNQLVPLNSQEEQKVVKKLFLWLPNQFFM